jgi:hypothetical protein
VENPFCDVVVPAQTGLSGVRYHPFNGETEVTFEPHVTGIAYTATGPGCPATGHFSNGDYTTGNVVITAEQGGSMVPISVHTP